MDKAKLLKGLREKTSAFVDAVTQDPRWDLQSELMVEVLGFTLYGYTLGVGTTVFFLDVPDIQKTAAEELVKLGVGRKYAAGMMESAQEIFDSEDEESVHAQLIQVGYSHFSADDLTEMRDSIFENTQSIQEQEE